MTELSNPSGKSASEGQRTIDLVLGIPNVPGLRVPFSGISYLFQVKKKKMIYITMF